MNAFFVHIWKCNIIHMLLSNNYYFSQPCDLQILHFLTNWCINSWTKCYIVYLCRDRNLTNLKTSMLDHIYCSLQPTKNKTHILQLFHNLSWISLKFGATQIMGKNSLNSRFYLNFFDEFLRHILMHCWWTFSCCHFYHHLGMINFITHLNFFGGRGGGGGVEGTKTSLCQIFLTFARSYFYYL